MAAQPRGQHIKRGIFENLLKPNSAFLIFNLRRPDHNPTTCNFTVNQITLKQGQIPKPITMTTTINGLHSCRAGNEPQIGQVKTFLIINNPAREGKKAWTKIKAAPEDMGGTPFRILEAQPTDSPISTGISRSTLKLNRQ